MTKPTIWPVRPAKIQISLGTGSLATHWAQSEDSDQTGLDAHVIFFGFVMCKLIIIYCKNLLLYISSSLTVTLLCLVWLWSLSVRSCLTDSVVNIMFPCCLYLLLTCWRSFTSSLTLLAIFGRLVFYIFSLPATFLSKPMDKAVS